MGGRETTVVAWGGVTSLLEDDTIAHALAKSTVLVTER